MKPRLEGKHVENTGTDVPDTTDRQAIETLVATQDTFDVLFNCADFVHHDSVLECTDDQWDMACDNKLKSTFMCQ